MADLRRWLVAAVAVLATGCTAVPQGGAVHKVAAAKAPVGVQDLAFQVAHGPVANASPTEIVNQLIFAMQSPDPNVISQYLTDTYATQWRRTWTTRSSVFSKLSAPKLAPGATGASAPVSLNLTLAGVIDSHGAWSRSLDDARISFDMVTVKGQWRVANISQPGLFLSLDNLSQTFRPVHIYYPSQERSPISRVPRLVPDTVYLAPDYTEGDLLSQLVTVGPGAWTASGVHNPVPKGATFTSVLPPDSNGLATFNFSGLGALKTGPPSELRTFEAQLAYTLAGSQYAGLASSIQIDNDGQPIDQPFEVDKVDPGYNPDLLDGQSPLFYVDAAHHLVEAPAPAAVAVAPGTTAAAEPAVRLEHLDNVSRIAVSPTLDVGGTATQLAAGVSPDHTKLELATLGDSAPDPWRPVVIPDATALSAPTFEVTGNSVWVVATLASGETRLYAVPLEGDQPGVPVVVPVTADVGVPAVKKVTVARLSRDGSRLALVSGTRSYVGVVEQLPTGGWRVTKARPLMRAIEHVSEIDVAWQDRFTLGVVTQKRVKSGSGDIPTTSLLTVQADGTPNGSSADPVTVSRTPDLATQFAGAPNRPWVASAKNNLFQQPSPSDLPDPSSQPEWNPLGVGSSPTYAD